MRKIATIIILFLGLYIPSANAAIIDPLLNANDIFLTVGKNGEKISLMELSRVKPVDLESLQGRKMKFMEKLCFRLAQKKLRASLEKDGTINNRRIARLFAGIREKGTAAVSGLALGFFLNVFGVLIAYLFKDPYRKKRIKWAWIGLGIVSVLVLIFALSVHYLRVE